MKKNTIAIIVLLFIVSGGVIVNRLMVKKNDSAVVSPPIFTGAKDNDTLPSLQVVQSSQSALLRQQLPIDNELFQMTMNYQTNSFMVQMKKNMVRGQLVEWLKVNGYGDIPEDQFVVAN